MDEAADAAGSSLVRARQSLHAIAEHVLAADLHARTGHIGLRVSPGGFATPVVGALGGAYRVRVDGTDLVVEDGDVTRAEPLTTVANAAAFLGIAPGAPDGIYPLATALEPDEPLDLDPSSVTELAEWMTLGDEAVARFASLHGVDASAAQLWPEHFDLGLTIGEVNFGVSPGDAAHDEPYLYVGPWNPPPVDDFWNEPFGARADRPQIKSIEDAVGFFEAGLRRLTNP